MLETRNSIEERKRCSKLETRCMIEEGSFPFDQAKLRSDERARFDIIFDCRLSIADLILNLRFF